MLNIRVPVATAGPQSPQQRNLRHFRLPPPWCLPQAKHADTMQTVRGAAGRCGLCSFAELGVPLERAMVPAQAAVPLDAFRFTAAREWPCPPPPAPPPNEPLPSSAFAAASVPCDH